MSTALINRVAIALYQATEDRRSVQLQVLPYGLAVLTHVPGPFEGVLPVALKRLPADTLLRLDQDLGELIALLKADEQAAGIPLAQLSSETGSIRERKTGSHKKYRRARANKNCGTWGFSCALTSRTRRHGVLCGYQTRALNSRGTGQPQIRDMGESSYPSTPRHHPIESRAGRPDVRQPPIRPRRASVGLPTDTTHLPPTR